MLNARTFQTPRGSNRRSVFLGVGASPVLFASTALVLFMALVAGGATRAGSWSDAFVQIASLALIVTLALVPRGTAQPGERFALVVVAAVIALPLLQLVPLPPEVWMKLPGRDRVATAFTASGEPLPWLPVSLDPGATERSLLSLLPAVGVFFATIALGHAARRTLTLLVLAIGVVAVTLGLAQIAEGPSSGLRFYPITNPSSSVGFFANVNHHAAFLYTLIPLVAGWVVALIFDRHEVRIVGIALGLVAYAAFLLGLGMALSRAGVLLAIGAAVASLAVAGRNERHFGGRAILFIGLAIMAGIALIAQFALFDIVDALDENPLGDLRVMIAKNTLAAAEAFQPVGSGIGTFADVYKMFEPTADLRSAYVNHAHDDWIELWLEGGWLAVAIGGLFLCWLITATIRTWRGQEAGPHTIDRALAQGASIGIVLLLVHSALDYPLRTTAMSTLFAFLCALLIPARRMPVVGPPQPERMSGRRHRSRASSLRPALSTSR